MISARKTQEQFVIEAMNVHGDKYDYTDAVYQTAHTRVLITCKRCSRRFEQSPHNHVRNRSGCMECSGKRRKTLVEFVEQARLIHDNRYSYEKSVYRMNERKIVVTCNRCKRDFEQTPHNHLSGHGCPICNPGNSSKKEQEWLDHVEVPRTSESRSRWIPGIAWKVDGYVGSTNTVYEFHGTYFHGDPRVYAAAVWNVKAQKTMGELHERTTRRAKILRDKGYNLVEMWELDWDRMS